MSDKGIGDTNTIIIKRANIKKIIGFRYYIGKNFIFNFYVIIALISALNYYIQVNSRSLAGFV